MTRALYDSGGQGTCDGAHRTTERGSPGSGAKGLEVRGQGARCADFNLRFVLFAEPRPSPLTPDLYPLTPNPFFQQCKI